MSTQVQYRRGSSAQNTAFTGALGEITVDTTNWTLRVHDGATAGGGGNLATVAYVQQQIGSLSADSISNGTSNVKVVSSGGNINVTVGGSTRGAFYSGGLDITGDLNLSGNITDTGAFSLVTGSNGNLTLALALSSPAVAYSMVRPMAQATLVMPPATSILYSPRPLQHSTLTWLKNTWLINRILPALCWKSVAATKSPRPHSRLPAV